MTKVKNRIRSPLGKYALALETDSDIFTPKWRADLESLLEQLPPETGRCVRQQLQILDALNQHIHQLKHRILRCCYVEGLAVCRCNVVMGRH